MPKHSSILAKSFKIVQYYIKFKIVLLICLSSILLFSCKTKKSILVDPNSKNEVSLDQIISSLDETIIPTWVNAKAKAKITDSYGSQQGKLYLKIKKDSVVWSAIKKLSYEAARSQLTQDSAYIINRLEKTWSEYSLKYIQRRYGLNPKLSYIQNILIGIPPPITENDIIDQKEDEDYFHLRVDLDGTIHDLSFDKHSGLLRKGVFKTQFGYDGTFTYEDYRSCNNGQALPFKRSYHITLNPEEFLDLKLEFSSIELDIPQKIKFDIPEHYTKI